MNIEINRESGVSLREQLRSQIAHFIASGQIEPGEALPSVRALATRLKVHHNTVSLAYQDLANDHMVERRPGNRMIIPVLGKWRPRSGPPDLDDVINTAIQMAQEHGFTLQELRTRVRERLLAQPPDHLLVVEQDTGLQRLLVDEVREQVNCPVESCKSEDLTSNRGLAIGALVVATAGTLHEVAPLLPKDRPPFQIKYSNSKHEVDLVRQLREPSAIALVSVSEDLLQVARGVLAPAIGRVHTLREYFFPSEKPDDFRAYSLVFCDSITCRRVKARNLVHYRLISSESLRELARAMKPPQQPTNA